MRNGKVRRGVAAVSATAMAGAALVVGGVGVASSAPESVTASEEFKGAGAGRFRIDRTISEKSPTYGDEVTVRTHVERTYLLDLLYGVRSDVPACFERIAGTTKGQARGGALIAEPHREFSFAGDRVTWNGPGVGPWFWMETNYRVLCDAGNLSTGGAEFASVARQYRGSMDLGPSITVARASLGDFFLRVPTSAEVGEASSLNVRTDAPDGSNITFVVGGQTLNGTVNDGEASVEWTPQSSGQQQITATFDRTSTHNGKTDTRTVIVAEQVVDSSVQLTVPSDAQYGVESELSATVTPATAAGGTVEFLEDGRVVASSVVPADGVVTVDWTPSAEGPVSIDARYLGHDGVRPSEAVGQSVTVAPAEEGKVASTISLDAVEMTQVGETVTLRATVSPEGAGGQVVFYDGSEKLGAADVNSEGVATFEWTPSAAGERTVRAAFSGTDTVLASQRTTSVIITSATDVPDPDLEEPGPTDPDTGSLGSLTDSLGGGADGAGSLSALGS